MEREEWKERRNTELVFLLDRSASMEGLEKDTIEGFQSVIKKQISQKETVRVTTILFDDSCEELYFRQRVKDVPRMTEKEYFVRGCTALLDAMGKTIHKMVSVEKSRKEMKKEIQVIFVIITDGIENSSREYTYDVVKRLIEKKKKEGWEFLFLGANMNAVREAGNLGISADRSVTFCNDGEGVALNYEVIGDTISDMLRVPAIKESIDGSWKRRIESDYRKRGK